MNAKGAEDYNQVLQSWEIYGSPGTMEIAKKIINRWFGSEAIPGEITMRGLEMLATRIAVQLAYERFILGAKL